MRGCGFLLKLFCSAVFILRLLLFIKLLHFWQFFLYATPAKDGQAYVLLTVERHMKNLKFYCVFICSLLGLGAFCLQAAPLNQGLTSPIPVPLKGIEIQPAFSLEKTRQQKLQRQKELLKKLKTEPDAQKAEKIAGELKRLWEDSGSDTVNYLLLYVQQALKVKNYREALDYLDDIVAIKPDYAQGWLLHASVHVQLNDLKIALKDVQHAVQAEPKDFSAYILLGGILEILHKKKAALQAYWQAVDIFPQLIAAQKRLLVLLEETGPEIV